MSKRLLSSILILSMFFVTMTWVPMIPVTNPIESNIKMQDDSPPITLEQGDLSPLQDADANEMNLYNLADDAPAHGVLDPASIEQMGYLSSGNQTALTDRNPNVGYDFPIDDAHDWMGSSAEVNVWNLTKTFVSNGTFDEGIPGINEGFASGVEAYPFGWNTWGYSPDLQSIQRTGYIAEDRKYVLLETEGDMIGTGANYRAQHTAGTLVQFNQTIVNAPYSESFVFEFDYSYVRGPLGLSVGENISLVARADGIVVWSTNLADLAQRNQWYSTGRVEFNQIGMNDTFIFQLALEIPNDLQIYVVDYGIINAAYFTIYVDDVVFDGALTPGFDEVDLQFKAGTDTTSIIGTSGTGSASIFTPSYWRTAPLSTRIVANTTVSYNYRIRLKTHRFTNSSWTTDTGLEGTSYLVSLGESSLLSFYAYIGFLGDYENLTQIFRFSSDWVNATVLDPFKTPVTGLCSVSAGQIVIPTSIMGRLGWWEVKLESPNYAKSIKSQIQDVGWTDETIFRIGNTTRAAITIGTDTETLGSLTDVNVTWFNPSDAVWATELRSGGVLGQIDSNPQIFNSGSSPAGEWWVEVYWTNGTEVAYDIAIFEVHHIADLVADPPEISTDTGLTIKGKVRYTDEDTGAYLLDASATLVANWSGSSIPLVAISEQNWWEANFDTSITGAGNFVIIVNASRPYYDDISCQILVHSVTMTRLSSPNAPWSAAEWGSIVSLTFNFEAYDYSTETWGPVINETDVSVNVNWTTGYWSVAEDITPGVYVMNLDTSVEDVETWLLNVTFDKPNYQSKIILITLILSPTTSSLFIMEGISERVDLEESFPLTLRFLDDESAPIASADVVVDSVFPSIGLERTPVTEIGGEPGNYLVTLTPHEAGVFTIRFVASKQNSENATAIFVLVVNDVATEVDIPGTGSVEIGLTDVYNTTFRFQILNGTGVENAQINITYTGGTADALTWDLADSGLGDYSVEFSSTSSGTYLITIAAFKQYYQSASDAFFLVVREISTNFTCLNGTADLVSFGKDYQISVSYTNGTGHGLAGANVTIENVVSDSILNWSTTVPGSPGIYSILLTPQAADSFTVLVQAKLPNHQTQFALFTLTATSIATTLTVLNASTTISLDQTFTVYLLYQDEDITALDNATVIEQNPPMGVDFSLVEKLGSGYYRVTITPQEVGTFDIIFKASKDGYQNGYASFTLGAIRIPTSLRTASGLSSDTMMYSEEYHLVVLYERIDTGVNISAATIDVQGVPGVGYSWSYEETGDGYVVTIIPTRVGQWTFTITTQLDGHASSSVEFILDAQAIPIHAEVLSGLLAVEGRPFNVSVHLTKQGTSEPVEGAIVAFRLTPLGTTGAGAFIEMEETSTPGVYTAEHRIPLYLETTQYELEIRVNKDNYLLPGESFIQSFVKNNDIILRMTPVITGAGASVIGLVVVIAVLRVRSTRRRVQIEYDVKNKHRFDDADNIVGVIVMHKNSGIPVYSRIVKGGFEEGIVAAFISAVTHFREEFEMFDEEAMKVIPISDIIRAVQTRNLICAFITLRSASIEHNRKMEAYGEQVATYLDDFYTESRPTGALDSRIAEILDYVFDETMDGNLIKFYKAASEQQFPRRYRLFEQLFEDIESRHCSRPIHLARGVATFGVSEARGCTLVLEAIEKRLIIQCDDHEPTVEDMEFADFFRKNKGNDKN